MEKNMNLNEYMEQGISRLIKTVGRYYLNNPNGIAFLAKTAPKIRKSAKLRRRHEAEGTHVPPMIIASITSRCNLHCTGCYSRATGGCSDNATRDLVAAEWEKILAEASGLGVSFVLMAGGEPLMRRDIIETAATFPSMVFPIFTNGTMIDEAYIKLFEERRNLIPVFSIEGGREMTDMRRGSGAYDTVMKVLTRFNKAKILYGVSITVTSENMDIVTHHSFVKQLREDGCGLVFFVEYVPVEPGTEALMLDETGIKAVQQAVSGLRDSFKDLLVVSFPGDEQAMGGCLASGRGFFHINSNGGAEPCPFSPHSQLNLRNDSIQSVLRSGYFARLRDIAASTPHTGGCTLFGKEAEVLALKESV